MIDHDAAPAREFTGRWRGAIRVAERAQHDLFVQRLRTPEGSDLLRRCGLTYYALFEIGNDLRVIFRSEKPSIIAGFLRNKRMWPEYWEFEGADGDPQEAEAPAFQWERA